MARRKKDKGKSKKDRINWRDRFRFIRQFLVLALIENRFRIIGNHSYPRVIEISGLGIPPSDFIAYFDYIQELEIKDISILHQENE